MVVILFRSKLTAEAGDDYQGKLLEMQALVRENPGFIEAKGYESEDGERLTLVWFRDMESLREWRETERHREAQALGRKKWYEYYKLEVATVERTSNFEKPAAARAPK